MKRLILAFLLASYLSSGWPADKDGGFVQFGTPHCDKFLEAVARMRANKDGIDYPHLIIWGWIAGYLTSYNMNVAETYNIIGSRKILEIEVESYCRAHPKDNLVQFMRTRIKEWHPTRRRIEGEIK